MSVHSVPSRSDNMVQKYRNVYGLDTETDNDGSTAWIVQWALSNGTKEFIGRDLYSFKDTLKQLIAAKLGKQYIYIHNLNYDFHFIKKAIVEICQEWNLDLQPIVRKGSIISVTLQPTKESPVKSTIIFRDSAKKIAGHLRDLAKTVKMEKLEGVSEDFHPGWSNEIDFTDPASWEYVKMDARIVAVSMRELHKIGDVRSTSSGDAWSAAHKFLAKDKEGKEYKKPILWDKYFPRLEPAIDKFCRRAYYGGVNISEHRGVNAATPDRPLNHEDIRSSYPTTIKFDKLPIGIPSRQYTMPDPDTTLFIGWVSIKFRVKDGCIPYFTFKDGADAIMEGLECGQPVAECRHYHNMALTNIDLITLSQFYDIEFEPDFPEEYLVFIGKAGIFADYIDHWYKVKESNEKGSIQYHAAKMKMNQLYGRFGLAIENTKTVLDWDDDLGDYNFREVAYEDKEDSDAYVPYAVFCTAYARARLLENVIAVGQENVIHCDTDSVVHYGSVSDQIGHTADLGDWDIEGTPLKIYEGGFKRYIEVFHEPIRSLKDVKVSCAGVPQRVNKNGTPVGMWVQLLDDPTLICKNEELGKPDYCIRSQWLRDLYHKDGLDPNCVDTRKLLPRKVPGGVILDKHTHRLNDGLVWRLRR